MMALARQIPAGHRLDEGGEVGEEQVHGDRAHRQDPGRGRPWGHRQGGRRAGGGAENGGGRVRPVRVERGRRPPGRGDGVPRRAVPPVRLHHLPHPAHPRNEGDGERGIDREDEGRGLHRQLRARGPRERGRPAGGPRVGESEGRGARRVQHRAASPGNAAPPASERDPDPAPRGFHQRGAGEGGGPDRGADLRFPQEGDHPQLREFPLRVGRAAPDPQALPPPRGAARRVPRAAAQGARPGAQGRVSRGSGESLRPTRSRSRC